jgi:hypothetical protein
MRVPAKRAGRISDQPHPLQARMPASAFNDVVVHGNPSGVAMFPF